MRPGRQAQRDSGKVPTRTVPALTPRQKEILAFIEDYWLEHRYPPTVRLIAESVGLASPATVHHHLKALVQAGWLKRDPGKPRAIRLTHPGGDE